jgi:hypothetical protein
LEDGDLVAHTHTAILNLYKPATDDTLGDSLTGFNANTDILDNAVIGVAGVLTLAHGGTAKALTASNGGIVYSDADSLEILTATATAQKLLMSQANVAPIWSTPTYPNTATLGKILIGDGTNVVESTPKYPNASATAGKVIRSDGTDYVSSTSTFADTYGVSTILYASSANVVAGLTTGNSGLLVTSAGGVPSIATDIPTAVTVGGKYNYRAEGTDIPVADGGTGLSTIADGSILVANTADTLTALTWHSAGIKMLVNTSGVLSMEAVTGTGAPVLANTPTLITPVLGVATGTSVDLGGTTLYGSRAITVDTGGVLDIALGSASGDDFTVDTDKLVVEGDTGNVSVGRLHVGGDSDPGDNNIMVDGKVLVPEIKTDTATPTDLTITTGAVKTLVLATPVYKDVNMAGILLGKPASSYPGSDTFRDLNGTDTTINTYAFAIDEYVSGGFELQHDYKEATDIVFHVHWQGIAAPDGGTDNVQWRLTYIIARDGVTLAAATTIDSPDVAITTRYRCYRNDFAAIVGTNLKIGDQFMFNLYRVAAASDDYAGDCLIETAGIHYVVDTLGSRSITAK